MCYNIGDDTFVPQDKNVLNALARTLFEGYLHSEIAYMTAAKEKTQCRHGSADLYQIAFPLALIPGPNGYQCGSGPAYKHYARQDCICRFCNQLKHPLEFVHAENGNMRTHLRWPYF